MEIVVGYFLWGLLEGADGNTGKTDKLIITKC